MVVEGPGREGSSPLRILLLEDSDIDAELLEQHLASGRLQFELDRATNRQQFELALERKPDVVLADYSLPDFDGLSALELTRSKIPGLPFIFVSGVVGEEFATNALLQGASDYVTKRNLRRLHVAVSRAVGEARERDQRYRAEAALRASEVGSRIALRAAKLGGWDYDLVRNRLNWDARCHAIFGIPANHDIEYQTFLRSLHPADRERTHREVVRATSYEDSSEFNTQFRVITPEGDTRWVESIGSAIFQHGTCVRFVGVVRDITDEKAAELALLDRTASLQASVAQQAIERHLLWRNSQDLLAVIGQDGRLRDVTPSWQRLLGYSPDETIGVLLQTMLHEDDVAETEAALAAARPQVPTRFENRLRHKDGGYRWFSWTASPDENSVFYANGRNITEEKDAAERMRVMEDTLRQSQKMEAIGQLTGGIAHDFNNLLAGIIGGVDIVKRRLKRQQYDDIDRFLDAAMTSAQRAASLTQRLLAFSRRQSLDVRATDIGGVISAMEDLLQRTLGENIMLRTEYEEGLWLGNTDANQLESAILNLAINSRDAMPEGGGLTITADNFTLAPGDPPIDGLEPGDYVRVAVADTGEGMSPEVISKAFDPFFTTKPIGQGTGLGLSMVYGFVNQSGGHVRILSQKGRGTRIELYLRRATALPEKAEPTLAAEGTRASHGEVVLVVEDDPAVRMLVLEVLHELGFASVEAKDAPTALPHIRSDNRIDLIITDVGLPGMDGRKLAELAREARPEMPILFVTGYAAGARQREVFLERGMQMLLKPFSNQDLARRIIEMLPSPAMARRG